MPPVQCSLSVSISSLRGWNATPDDSYRKHCETTGCSGGRARPSSSDQPAEHRLWHVFRSSQRFPRAAVLEFVELFPAVRKIPAVPILSYTGNEATPVLADRGCNLALTGTAGIHLSGVAGSPSIMMPPAKPPSAAPPSNKPSPPPPPPPPPPGAEPAEPPAAAGAAPGVFDGVVAAGD